MARATARRWAMALSGTLALGACEEIGDFQLFPNKSTETSQAANTVVAGETIETDVEAPDVFQATELGLWDGRPSLGGVWVAHPDATDPERVLIRNESSGSSVIGALFRRERETPGPRIQISSDAAEALSVLAGQPTELNVVALRRELVPLEPEPAPVADGLAGAAAPLPADDIEAAPLDPISAAAAAIDEADQAGVEPAAITPAATAAAAPRVSPLAKPYIQIGIFSVEANANNTAASLRNIGIVPTVRRQQSQGKTFWRVIVGPSNTTGERATILRQVKDLGFADAYFVTN